MASWTLLTLALVCEQHGTAPVSRRPQGTALPVSTMPAITSYDGVDARFGKGSSPPRGRPV